MMYFFDTNTCIYFLKGFFPGLQKKVLESQPDRIRIPAIVAAELVYGAQKSEKAAQTMEKIGNFLRPLQIVPFDMEAAIFYGKIRASLEKTGNIIGLNDMIIAATVLAHNGTLVTSNIGDFSCIESLLLDDWSHG